jgi:hypothetical protein
VSPKGTHIYIYIYIYIYIKVGVYSLLRTAQGHDARHPQTTHNIPRIITIAPNPDPALYRFQFCLSALQGLARSSISLTPYFTHPSPLLHILHTSLSTSTHTRAHRHRHKVAGRVDQLALGLLLPKRLSVRVRLRLPPTKTRRTANCSQGLGAAGGGGIDCENAFRSESRALFQSDRMVV